MCRNIKTLFNFDPPATDDEVRAAPLRRALGVGALALAVCILTGGFVSARQYMLVGGAPADVIALRYGISGALLVPFVVLARGRLGLNPGWPRALLLALAGGAPFGAMVFIGLSGAPVAHGAAVVPALALVVGTGLAYRFLGEQLGTTRLTGLVFALVGLAVLVGPDLRDADVTLAGEAAFCAAGMLWATFTLLLRRFGLSALDGAALSAVFSLPYLVVYLLVLDPQLPNVPIASTVVHGIYQGIVFNIIGITLYGWGVARLGAASAVAAMPLMPAYGSVMDWWILGREPHAGVPVAIFLMVIGVGLAIANTAQRGEPG